MLRGARRCSDLILGWGMLLSKAYYTIAKSDHCSCCNKLKNILNEQNLNNIKNNQQINNDIERGPMDRVKKNIGQFILLRIKNSILMKYKYKELDYVWGFFPMA